MTPPANESWSIRVHKDYLKFSAAHFLIFPNGAAERMHGHNYKVYVEMESPLDAHGLVVNFKEIKPIVRELCDGLDEHVLIPGRHPVLSAAEQDGSTEVRYMERRYVIPSDEVILLPITNTSAENLAAWIGRTLRERIRRRWPSLPIRRLEVSVEESPGQQGIYALEEGAIPDSSR
ncbi:MAG: 6-pyruvoyl tetrahydropterin synthase family protein [Planctomycetota bacterium]